MEAESNNLRIAVGTTLAIVGGGLVGVAMEIISRIQPAPWWAILLLILSSAMLIIGLLILIAPLEKWKGLFSPINIYRRIDNARLWWVRGPKWSWSKPTIKLDGFTPNNPNLGLVRYFTTLSLDIENRDDFSLKRCLLFVKC